MKNRDRVHKKLNAEHQKAIRKQNADSKKARQRAIEIATIEAVEKRIVEIRKCTYVKPIIGEDFISQVKFKAPKLFDYPYNEAVAKIPRTGWIRDISTWKPLGKSRYTQFISLVEHLLSKYKTPQFLWSAFFDREHAEKTVPLAVHVAGGGSLYEKVQDGSFPVPFTRKLCHEFLKTPSDYAFMSAVRKIQVEAAGGDRRLFQIWHQTRHALRLGTVAEEAFSATVLHFFAKTTMLDPAQILPTIDYIYNRHREDPTFSMKGRSMLALMRDRDEWHTHLSRVKVLKKQTYAPSGFKPREYTKTYPDSRKGGHYQIVWRIFEILKSNDLADEGRAMRHCVYSYAPRIEEGKVSIWSLCGESRGQDLRYLTIEVNNISKQIVQLRGICNSKGGAQDLQIVAQWAADNGLTINTGRW